MELYILRHGESMGNLTMDYSTLIQDSLSPTGHEQSRKLIDRFKVLHFDVIYCSPLERAVQTIMPYAESESRKVEIWPELAEACWQSGFFPNIPEEAEFAEFEGFSQYGDMIYFRDNFVARPMNENYWQGLSRVNSVISLLMERHKGTSDRVLIVAHGCINSRLIEVLMNMEPLGAFHYDNTGVTLLRDDLPEVDGFKIMYSNLLT